MNKRKDQLDKLLAELPGKTPPPLAGWHFSAALRQRVQERVSSLQADPLPGGTRGSRKSRWRRFRLAGVAALALIFVLLSRQYLPVDPGGPPAGFKVRPLQYQRVNLNDPYREAVVSIGRVEGSNQLLAAISKRREPEGWELVYTQPLNAYMVLPVKVMHTSSDQVALILIAYQEQGEAGYRYLLLRFDGERVIPYSP